MFANTVIIRLVMLAPVEVRVQHMHFLWHSRNSLVTDRNRLKGCYVVYKEDLIQWEAAAGVVPYSLARRQKANYRF